MNKNLWIIILALGCVACGRQPSRDLGEFAGYVEKFESVSIAQGRPVRVEDLKMKFAQMDRPTEQAVCILQTDEQPQINVNKAAWDRMTETERQSVIFHELGHCVLLRKHVNALDSDNDPISLMNPYALDPTVYEAKMDHYHQELFHNR